MGAYGRRSHDKAQQSSGKEVLVDVRLHGMTEEYRNFLKNLFFHSFCMLMEATKRKNESLKDLKV